MEWVELVADVRAHLDGARARLDALRAHLLTALLVIAAVVVASAVLSAAAFLSYLALRYVAIPVVSVQQALFFRFRCVHSSSHAWRNS
jgi:hypothetical protein